MKKVTRWGAVALGLTAAVTVCATFVLADFSKKTSFIETSIASPVSSASGTMTNDEVVAPKLTDAVQPSFVSLKAGTIDQASSATKQNAQSYIFYQMLNAVDFYDTISGEIENRVDGSIAMYTFSSDLRQSTSYESVTENGQTTFKRYCDGQQAVAVCAATASVSVGDTVVTQQDSLVLAEPMKERIGVDEEGIPFYVYRADSSNLSCASLCTLPQELAFSFLTNFDAWEIAGTTSYLGRDCVILSGIPTAYHQGKLGVSQFTFYVDYETGVLLKYEGYDTVKNVVDSIVVKDIHIDEPVIVPDMTDDPMVAKFLQEQE